MTEQPKIITKTVDPENLDTAIAELCDKGYLVASVKDVEMPGGSTKKEITAKHKDIPVRPGLDFVD